MGTFLLATRLIPQFFNTLHECLGRRDTRKRERAIIGEEFINVQLVIHDQGRHKTDWYIPS